VINGSYTDYVGGLSLVPNGAISLVADRLGNAYGSFESTSGSWAQAPSAPYVFTGADFSITMWFKLVSYGAYQALFDFGNGANGDSVVMFNNGNSFYFVLFNQGTYLDLTLASSLTTGVWTHMAVVTKVSVANSAVYINGVMQANGTQVMVRNVSRPGYFGKDDWNNYDDIMFDEIKLHSRALTATEVLNDYGYNQSYVSFV
jgi:hypothetical protein